MIHRAALLIVLSSLVTLTALPARAQSPTADPSALQLASVSASVTDLETGASLYRKHADLTVPIASVTKLMSAVVVLEGGQPLEEWLNIVDWDQKLEKNAYSRLRRGSEAQRGELLRIALMSSENLATHVLARHYPGGLAAFVEAMNDKVRTLGMVGTRFVDPAGLSPHNRSTADDLARLVRAAHSDPRIREYSTGYQHQARFRNPRYSLPYGNTNPLVASSRWSLGLSKTGYLTEAGRCLVMVAEIDGRPIAVVLLNSFGSRTPLGDAGRVRRWLTTGSGGRVAGAALEYERRATRALTSQGNPTAGGG